MESQKTVEKAQDLGGVETFVEETKTKGLRGEKIPLSTKALGYGAGFGLHLAKFPGETIQFGKALITKPKTTITGIPKGIQIAGTKFFKELESPTPEIALGGLTAELLILKGTGKALKLTGRGIEISRTRLSPKFIATIEGKIKGRGVDIKVAPPVSKITEPLSKQVKIAGTEVDKAVSAQTSFPFGKLERTFFADPKGRLRISRLGLEGQKEASILDILSGEDIAFRQGRRQALIFERAMVEKFPLELKGVERTLRGGGALSPSQIRKLTKFQEIPSGKFKPIGFVSKEPEITLPAGEIVLRKGKKGVTLIKGRRVELLEAEIGTKSLEKDLKLFSKQLTQADKDLSKVASTSFSTEPISRKIISPSRMFSPFVSLRKFTRGISKTSKRPSGRVSISPGISRLSIPKVLGISKVSGISPSLRRSIMGISPRVSPSVPFKTFTPPLDFPITTPRSFEKIMGKKRKIKGRGREDIGISEGFVARQLQLKPMKIKGLDIYRLSKMPLGALGIRLAPIIK